MEQLFVNLEKARYETKAEVRQVLASKHPDMEVQAILDSGDTWFSRLVPVVAADPSKLEEDTDADLPALPGEEGPPAPKDEAEEDEAPEGEEDAPKDEESDDEAKGEKDDKKKSPKKPKDEDIAAKVQKLIDQLSDVLSDLGGATSELQTKHDEHKDKLDQIGDLAGGPGDKGPEGLGDLEDTPEEIGPTAGPGGPGPMGADGPPGDMGGPMAPPKGPSPAKGFDKRKKPAVGVPAFTNNKMVSTPLFKDNGEKVTVATAVNRVYSLEKYASYEVYGVQPDEDKNRYIIHLIPKN